MAQDCTVSSNAGERTGRCSRLWQVLRSLTVLIALTASIVLPADQAEAQGSFDREMVQLINDYRIGRGLRPLAVSAQLTADAQAWSQSLTEWTGIVALDGSLIGQEQAVTGWFGYTPCCSGQPGSNGWPIDAPIYCKTGMAPDSAEFFACDLLTHRQFKPIIDDPSLRQIGSGTADGHNEFGPTIAVTVHFNRAAPPGGALPHRAAHQSQSQGTRSTQTSSGHQAALALKADGRLWTRFDSADGDGWSEWFLVGDGRWVASDVAMASDRSVHIAAVKETGQLLTRAWTRDGLRDWVDHGLGWSTETMPSISTKHSDVVLGAVTSSGRVRTKTYADGVWSAATVHGARGWAQVDVDIASDGDLWLVATKLDGRLYLRKHLGTTWSGFAKMGAPTWSSDTAPSIAARRDGVVFGAVKTDGRLYTREQTDGQWAGYVRHGVKDWSSVDVGMTWRGEIALAAHKDWGRLYTRAQPAEGAWMPWERHGGDTWSVDADPSIALGIDGEPVLVAVKETGTLYYRDANASGWGSWTKLGGRGWSAGS